MTTPTEPTPTPEATTEQPYPPLKCSVEKLMHFFNSYPPMKAGMEPMTCECGEVEAVLTDVGVAAKKITSGLQIHADSSESLWFVPKGEEAEEPADLTPYLA